MKPTISSYQTWTKRQYDTI